MMKNKKKNKSSDDFVGSDKVVQSGERNINISGNVSGSTIIAGDGNKVSYDSTSDDLISLIQQIQDALNKLELDTETINEIKSDLAKVGQQISKPEPNKGIILKRLKSSLEYAKLITAAAPLVELLRKSVIAATQLLGGN